MRDLREHYAPAESDGIQPESSWLVGGGDVVVDRREGGSRINKSPLSLSLCPGLALFCTPLLSAATIRLSALSTLATFFAC